jgi:hypothetical protein
MQKQLHSSNIGLMLTPFSQRNSNNSPYQWNWAADNGCFASKWDENTWVNWLKSFENTQKALFATVPDVVANHAETLKRWGQYNVLVSSLGYKPAFVLQDGASIDDIPWEDMGCLFIGGSTDFKLSLKTKFFCAEAKARSIWIHMGRVNSLKRMLLAREWGVDSVDGTYLAFGPDVNTPKLLAMVNKMEYTPIKASLPLT